MKAKRILSWSLAVPLSLAMRASAQQPAPPLIIQPSVARMVIVDAYVADSKGRPITDLRQDDFELREDSRPVEIAAFEPPRPGDVSPRFLESLSQSASRTSTGPAPNL